MSKNKNGQIAFKIKNSVYVLDFDNISWMYTNVFINSKYNDTVVRYSEHFHQDSITIFFETKEQAAQLVKMFEEYCKLKYNYCDNLCVNDNRTIIQTI